MLRFSVLIYLVLLYILIYTYILSPNRNPVYPLHISKQIINTKTMETKIIILLFHTESFGVSLTHPCWRLISSPHALEHAQYVGGLRENFREQVRQVLELAEFITCN
jgi:hypothetical protein